MITYCATDVGKRPNNEDAMSIITKDQELLMIVCDGMGGHNAGDFASKLASKSQETLFANEPITFFSSTDKSFKFFFIEFNSPFLLK